MNIDSVGDNRQPLFEVFKDVVTFLNFKTR